MTEDAELERAILDLLASRREVYPLHIMADLRRRHPGLRVQRTRAVLERLFAERRVARLWHRYLLASDVEAVRARWLERIQKQAACIDADPAAPGASAAARASVAQWDGWRILTGDGPGECVRP